MRNRFFELEQIKVRKAFEQGLSLREVGVDRGYSYYLTRELDDKFTLRAEIEAIKNQIALERDLDPADLELYRLSNSHDYGRVFHGAVERSTGRGLIFTVYQWPRSELKGEQHQSDGEVNNLRKFARRLGIDNLEVLSPLYLINKELTGRLNAENK